MGKDNTPPPANGEVRFRGRYVDLIPSDSVEAFAAAGSAAN